MIGYLLLVIRRTDWPLPIVSESLRLSFCMRYSVVHRQFISPAFTHRDTVIMEMRLVADQVLHGTQLVQDFRGISTPLCDSRVSKSNI